MLPAFLLAALLVFLQRGILCLKDVVLEIEPKVVEKGGTSTLKCSYDLEGGPLYTVSWYRGHHEFYRYTPKDNPKTKIFPFTGVHVDLKQSNEHQVVLRKVGFNLSGKFSCEVTTDAPLFTAVTVSKNMSVVVLPSKPPTLTTERSYYEVGDTLRANCKSSPSKPPANLTFVLSTMVYENCILHRNTSGDLTWSQCTLELPLFDSQFIGGRLTLKCVARIGDFYQQDSDEFTSDNVKDPVPARVTQSSASDLQPTFSIGLLISVVFFVGY